MNDETLNQECRSLVAKELGKLMNYLCHRYQSDEKVTYLLTATVVGGIIPYLEDELSVSLDDTHQLIVNELQQGNN